MSKRYIIGLVLILVFILATGAKCKSSNLLKKDRGGGAALPTSKQFNTGTKGLEIEFLEYMPPEDILEDSDFRIGLKVTNAGTHDLDDAVLYMNIDDDLIGIQETDEDIELIPSLKGKNQNYPEGEFHDIEFGAKTKRVKADKTTTIKALVCYKYTTKASVDVCINPYSLKKLKIGGEEGCKVGDVSLSGGQGAPVAIEKVEVKQTSLDASSFEITFIIHIDNRGGTKDHVRKLESYDKECKGKKLFKKVEDADYVKVNNVQISKYSLKEGSVECKPLEKGQLKLDDGEGELVCKAKLMKKYGSYLSPLRVDLSYGYISTIKETIKIENIAKV